MKQLFLIASLCLLPIIGFTVQLDSLRLISNDENQSDTTRLLAILDLAWEYKFNKPDSSLILSNQALQLAKHLQWQENIAEALNYIAIIYDIKGDYLKTIQFYQKSLSIREKIGNNTQLAIIYNNLGIYYNSMGNIAKAIEYYNKAISIHEVDKNENEKAIVLINIANILFNNNNLKSSMEYCKKAIVLFQKSNNKEGLSTCYAIYGDVMAEKGKHSTAIDYFKKAYHLNKINENQHGIANNLLSMGLIYSEYEQGSKALSHISKALSIFNKLGNKNGSSKTYFILAKLLFEENEKTISKVYAEKSFSLAQQSGYKHIIGSSAEFLAKLYQENGNSKEALKMLNVQIEIEEQLNSIENKKSITKIKLDKEHEAKALQFMLDKKRKQKIAIKEKERIQLASRSIKGGTILFLLYAFIIIYRLLLVRKQKKVITKQKDSLELQSNKLDNAHKENQALLHNILPEKTAIELIENNGKVLPKQYEQVTILFTDFKGFTKIAENLSAEDLVNDLGILFEKFDKIVEEHNVEKIKTIGDAYMCAGGVPEKNTTNPLDVTKASLAIQKEMLNFNAERNKIGKQTWEIRIGIHTGPVITGVVGKSKFAYDLWGDAVNTASRLESAGEVGKINLSKETYELIKDHFKCEYRGKIEVKNKGKIDMYFLKEKI